MKRVSTLPVSLLAMALGACSGDGPSGATPDDPDSPPLVPPIVAADYGVRVRVVTTGTNLDLDGYVVRIQMGYSGDFKDVPIGVNDSLVFKVMQRSAVEVWFIRLIGLEPNCWVSLPNVRAIAPRPDSFPQLAYSVECVPPSSIHTYDRVTPHSPGNVSFHGSLSERYVLRRDGMFRLQYASGRWGLFEYLGTFTHSPSDSLKVYFQWDADDRWSGTAILRSDSLFVEYNDIMLFSDFEPGAYVYAASAKH